MIISSNYNYSYSFQSKKAEKDSKQTDDKSPIDKLKTMHENNSEIVTDFASALLMSKINFISNLIGPKTGKNEEKK